MITTVRCPQKKVIGFRSKCADNYFQTSYQRSHFYETPVAHPLYVARVKIRFPEDLQIQKPFPDNYVSVYNKEHNAKFVDYLPDYYGKPPTVNDTGLKSLHEKYVMQLIKPFKFGLPTTGSTYVSGKKPFEPLTLPHSSPVDDATCTIIAFGRDEFPPIPPNEPGAYKHMDPLVSTAHLAHVNFTTERRNGLPKNDAVTYYATTGSQSHRKNVLPIGPYFPRCPAIDPHPVYPKPFRVVPYNGRNSTYNKDYDHVPRIPLHSQPNPQFPSVFKLSRSEVLVTPAMYCTEQSRGSR